MEAPACLDGGDVLALGEVLFVRRSDRTNAAGIQVLREVMGSTGIVVEEVTLRVSDLHLKCVCSSPAPGLVLVAHGAMDVGPLAHVARVIEVPREEAYAANAVGVNGHVMIPEGYPVTQVLLEEAGLVVTALDNAQFRAADGAMTCLSVVFDRGTV